MNQRFCVLVWAWLAGAVAGQAAPATSAVRFGCQARTFGAGIYPDEATFLNVVRQIGEVGFEGLEANWKNLERYYERPTEFARILQAARLKLIGAHFGGSPWAAPPPARLFADLERTARFVRTLGGECVVFSGSLPKAGPLPPDTWPKLAEFLNEAGRVSARNGIRLLYHNHWAECEDQGLEKLCRLTDPPVVGFAFDTGHAVRAGRDPAGIIAVLAGRLGVIHFADAAKESTSKVPRPPLGEGQMQIPSVVAALRQVGFNQWIVLEEEAAGNGRTLAENGLALFRRRFSRTQDHLP